MIDISILLFVLPMACNLVPFQFMSNLSGDLTLLNSETRAEGTWTALDAFSNLVLNCVLVNVYLTPPLPLPKHLLSSCVIYF